MAVAREVVVTGEEMVEERAAARVVEEKGVAVKVE
jgi:hypothetical protein